ncbi:MAG: antitoxin Xre/MbcA/ParS toxin-binding domain-containing protein [Pseudomonadota bacterium]
MGNEISHIILTSIYNEWGLSRSDRRLIDSLGLEGAEALCAVHVALGQVFSHNPQLAALWPTTANKGLRDLSPMELIRRDGMAGLKRVRAALEQEW